MDNKNPYFRQVALLVRLLPLISRYPCLYHYALEILIPKA